MSSVSAFYWFLKCTSPGASGGFAPLTPTGALPLDPTRGPWAGPWTPGRKALATLACSLRIAESDFWDFNVGRYVHGIVLALSILMKINKLIIVFTGLFVRCLVNSAQNQLSPILTWPKTNSAHVMYQLGPNMVHVFSCIIFSLS